MKLNQFADILKVKKAENVHHKRTQMGKKRKKPINLNRFENFKNRFLIFHRKHRLQKSLKYQQIRCNFEDKMANKKRIKISYNGI